MNGRQGAGQAVVIANKCSHATPSVPWLLALPGQTRKPSILPSGWEDLSAGGIGLWRGQ